ncbi:MAG: PAS domain S-box protein [Nitrospiraceae bacterium]|nr:PAS domain S-box protein [Nitrospiraceae bacterium]
MDNSAEDTARLETLIQAMPEMVFLKDAGGRYVMVNRAVEEFYGRQASCFTGKTSSDILPPAEAKKCDKSDAEAIRKGQPVHAEELFTGKNGQTRCFDTIKVPLYDKNAQLEGLLSVSRDITEQKRLEKALHRSESKFRTLFDSTADALFIVEMNGNLVDANRTAYERLGYTKEEIMSMNLYQLDAPDSRPRIPERVEHIKKNGWGIFELAHLRKDGTVMPVEICAKVIEFEGRDVIFSSVRDITARKRAQEAQRQSERRYRRLFENANDAIFIIDMEGENAGRIVDANQVAAKMHGYTVEELLKLRIEDVDSPEDAKLNPMRRELSLKGQWLKAEIEHRKKDGSIFPVDITAGLFEEGGHKYVFAIERDITVRKKTEETIRKFANVVQHTKTGVSIGMEDGTLGLVNPAFAEMHGYTVDELYGMPIADTYAPESRAGLPMHIATIHEKGYHKFETFRLRKDGSVFPAEVEAYAIKDKEGRTLYRVANVIDITERKKAEEKLKASLTEKEILLREIYHRTKNNMQVISGLLNLQSMPFEDSCVRQAFKETQDRIRAMSLVHEMLYRSKDLSSLDIEKYMEDLADVTMKSHPAKASTVSMELEIESLPLSIDLATPCGLIINELLSNSMKYAFPGNRKGQIRIVMHKKSGDEVELVYSDDGVGLPEGLDVSKTKTLGLRLVNSLVANQLKGKLHVSKKGGTRFQINFSLIGQ